MTQIQASMGKKIRGEIVSELSPFDSLPEDCISSIISFTSPRDACVAATVSKTFESAAKSDLIWEKFIPADYVSLAPPSRVFSTKKELYFALCNDPLLIDDSKMSIWLEKASGKRCIMLSARYLSIILGEDTTDKWLWGLFRESRFKMAAILHYYPLCWFQMRGAMNTRVLSPRTRYSAYIVFKIISTSNGFEDAAIEAADVVVGHEPSRRSICFDGAVGGRFIKRDGKRRNVQKPEEREDGWMEIGLGDFFNVGVIANSDEIEMSTLKGKELQWTGRGRLIFQGIEIRPAKIL